jgi:transposase InsO family protein
MAVAQRCPARLLHHSDRGSQYTSDAYQAPLTAHSLVASMSRKGDCWDNAVSESFVATLETELIEEADRGTRVEARCAIAEFIEQWLQPEAAALESRLSRYRSPVRFELAVLQRGPAA